MFTQTWKSPRLLRTVPSCGNGDPVVRRTYTIILVVVPPQHFARDLHSIIHVYALSLSLLEVYIMSNKDLHVTSLSLFLIPKSNNSFDSLDQIVAVMSGTWILLHFVRVARRSRRQLSPPIQLSKKDDAHSE